MSEAAQWQPIETAPKDGTDILLTDGYRAAVASWYPEEFPDAEWPWGVSDWHNDPLHLRGGYMATHWMPLPMPPTPSSSPSP